MRVEIKNRFNGEIIISGKYDSIKDALEKNVDADLRDADLRGSDLTDAYLTDAYLRDADLRDADLRGSDLTDAYLRDADLRGSDLRDADLRGSDLTDADLTDADLRGSDLRDAKNVGLPIISISGTAHSFYYHDGIIRVGCEKHTFQHWIENYRLIGKNNDYAPEQIKEYFGYIKMCKKYIKELKNET